MPSRAYTSFLQQLRMLRKKLKRMCQCPLGLIPHFYSVVFRAKKSWQRCVSMPSRAYTSFLQGNEYPEAEKYMSVSMPSRAYTSFLLWKLHLLCQSWQIQRVNALSGLYLISTQRTGPAGMGR